MVLFTHNEACNSGCLAFRRNAELMDNFQQRVDVVGDYHHAELPITMTDFRPCLTKYNGKLLNVVQ